jgi:hypothetical protein
VPRLGQIDLFVHDSMHTARNVRFELEPVWPALTPGGAVLIDDVERTSPPASSRMRDPGRRPWSRPRMTVRS